MTDSASPQKGYFRNATAAGGNFFDWAAAEAARSRRFQSHVDRLRERAAGRKRDGYGRTTGPLTTRTWAEITRLRPELLSQPQSSRPRAWKSTELSTDEGYSHVRDYERAIRKTARQFIGSEAAAEPIHNLVATTGYQLPSFHSSAPPPPTGGTASSLAAHITGASWGAGATALRIAWARARPGDTFNH